MKSRQNPAVVFCLKCNIHACWYALRYGICTVTIMSRLVLCVVTPYRLARYITFMRNIFQTWRWKQYVPAKRWFKSTLHTTLRPRIQTAKPWEPQISHSYLAWLKPSGVATVNYTPAGFTAEKYITLVKQDIINTSVSFVCSEMLLWYSSGGLTPALYRESPGLSSGQSMWDLWWTKKHWYRCVSGYFTSPDRIIPPLLHIHSCVIWGMYRGPVSVPGTVSPHRNNGTVYWISISRITAWGYIHKRNPKQVFTTQTFSQSSCNKTPQYMCFTFHNGSSVTQTYFMTFVLSDSQKIAVICYNKYCMEL
jgi:hypothetical protein